MLTENYFNISLVTVMQNLLVFQIMSFSFSQFKATREGGEGGLYVSGGAYNQKGISVTTLMGL